MRVEFPEYRDGIKHWNNNIFVREVDENDYCQKIEDADKMITSLIDEKNFKSNLDLLNYIQSLKDDISNSVETQRPPKFIGELYKSWKLVNNCNCILYDYPFNVKEYWENKAKELYEIGRLNWKKTSNYIISNKDAIFELLEQKKNILVDKRKDKKKIYNETYRNKLKEVGLVKERVILTLEERAEHMKEQKRISNEKYRNKLKEVGLVKDRIILTPEERIEHKKETNRKYYLKRKVAKDNCEKITIEL